MSLEFDPSLRWMTNWEQVLAKSFPNMEELAAWINQNIQMNTVVEPWWQIQKKSKIEEDLLQRLYTKI